MQTRLDASLDSSVDCIRRTSRLRCVDMGFGGKFEFEICSELAAACWGAKSGYRFGETRGILCDLEIRYLLYFVLLVAELLEGDLGPDNALADLLALVVAVVVVESDDG